MTGLCIAIGDKELFGAALSLYLAGRTVDIIYTASAAPKTAAGHVAGLQCKVMSIF